MPRLPRLLFALTLAAGWIIQPGVAREVVAACSTGSCATLEVVFGNGAGSGLVTSYPAGIACSWPTEPDLDTCVAQFDVGSGLEVTLYLDPGVHSYACYEQVCGGHEARLERKITLFAGGDNHEVYPGFNAAIHTHVAIEASGTGSGQLTLFPSNVDCQVTLGVQGGACDANFYTVPGAPIEYTFRVNPDASSFACIGTFCTFDDVTQQKTFSTGSGGTITIETTLWLAKPVTVSVTGSGTVTSNPAGISCPSTCSKFYLPWDQTGKFTTLTASPAAGWFFSGWGGACDEFEGPICNIVVGYEGAAASATFGREGADPTPTARPAVTPTPAPPIKTASPPPAAPASAAAVAGSPEASTSVATSAEPAAAMTAPVTQSAPPAEAPTLDASSTSFDSIAVLGLITGAATVLALGYFVGSRITRQA